MTQQPIVMQCHETRDPTPRQQRNDTGRQTREVVHVGHVGCKRLDEIRGDLCDRRVVVGLGERSRRPKGVVDPRDRLAVAMLGSHAVLWCRGIVLTRHHEDRVAVLLPQRACLELGNDLTATLRVGWKPVHHR